MFARHTTRGGHVSRNRIRQQNDGNVAGIDTIETSRFISCKPPATYPVGRVRGQLGNTGARPS